MRFGITSGRVISGVSNTVHNPCPATRVYLSQVLRNPTPAYEQFAGSKGGTTISPPLSSGGASIGPSLRVDESAGSVTLRGISASGELHSRELHVVLVGTMFSCVCLDSVMR